MFVCPTGPIPSTMTQELPQTGRPSCCARAVPCRTDIAVNDRYRFCMWTDPRGPSSGIKKANTRSLTRLRGQGFETCDVPEGAALGTKVIFLPEMASFDRFQKEAKDGLSGPPP